MKITAIEHHDVTTKIFKKYTKVSKTFAAWRQCSKTVNFGVLFGCQANTLATQLANNNYSPDEARVYISNMHLDKQYRENIEDFRRKGKDADKAAIYTAAVQMLQTYYDSYPGVKIRAEREIKNAWNWGYSENWHGTIRHLPELRFMQRDMNGNILSADKNEFSAMVSNRQNQAGNSPIQALEAYITMSTIYSVSYYAKKWHLKSYLWNMVHDSEDWCVYKPEADLVASLIEACSTYPREPLYGVRQKMDFSWCDPSKGREYNLYHGGEENPWKVLPIEEAVKVWNDDHKDVPGFEPLVWEGVPL